MNKEELFKKVEGKLHNYKYLQIKINNLELDIEKERNDYRGCGAISYEEKSGVTYNINRSVENEVIAKEKRIGKLMQEKINKEIEKRKIENALTCLDDRETKFFELYYKSSRKNTIRYISRKIHLNEKHTGELRKKIVYKIMDMLYPELKNTELPLLKKMQG